MLFIIMTYILKAHCARVKIYYKKLLQHHKAILKGYKTTENVTAKGGRKIPWRDGKETPEIDKDILLVEN